MAAPLMPKLTQKNYGKKENDISLVIVSSVCTTLVSVIYLFICFGGYFFKPFQMTFTNSLLFDRHISLVSQLVREGIAVFSLGKETQRGCDLLKDHVRGSDRLLPETADWSLPSQESPGEPEPRGHL